MSLGRGILPRQASLAIALALVAATSLPVSGSGYPGQRAVSGYGPIPRYTSNPYSMQFNPSAQFNGAPANYVMTNPHVYLTFWGSQWNDSTTTDLGGVYNQLSSAIPNQEFLRRSWWQRMASRFNAVLPGEGSSSSCSGDVTYV